MRTAETLVTSVAVRWMGGPGGSTRTKEKGMKLTVQLILIFTLIINNFNFQIYKEV